MIGLLRGPVVLRAAEGEVIMDVGGVGYRVTVTPATAAALMVVGTGAASTLFIHTHVREDAIVLYGFVHDDERRCFEVLLGSHGVGPALALAIMATMVEESTPPLRKAPSGTSEMRRIRVASNKRCSSSSRHSSSVLGK